MEQSKFIHKKRNLIFTLSAITSALYAVFVVLISVDQKIISGPTIILLGFALIAYSILIVAWYGAWANRFSSKYLKKDV